MISRAVPLTIASVVFALDRLTKVWIERNVPLHDSFPVIPGFFDIVHAKNRGAAFGMFADTDHPLRTVLLIGVSAAVLAFVLWILLKPDKSGAPPTKLTVAGLALVAGGALGNIWDRIAYGMVTDFIEIYQGAWRFAAFNIADSGITVGAALLILDMLRTGKQGHAAQTR